MRVSCCHYLLSLAASALLLMAVSCGHADHGVSDRLNDAAYSWHYRNLDSTVYYARLAMEASEHYFDGKAEALNNLAFVNIVRMDYALARRRLDSVPSITGNQIERLIAYVQQMRLCQRRSANREFYDYRERALQCLSRIDEDRSLLTERQQARLLYAETEMAIVTSTYFYYVGLEQQSSEAMLTIKPIVERDTSQLMNYLYNVGAGGIIHADTQAETNQIEFDHLMRCFLIAQRTGSIFFAANALEAIAEHIINPYYRELLINDNMPAMKYVNPDGISDDMLPQWLADCALTLFREYGDTYQTAGAYRTLASCHLAQDEYESALFCLEQALSDSVIDQAPDLVASIREQMSVACAAVDDKAGSDMNRNIYLDLQDDTRQDRQLEARAGQLEQSLRHTEWLLWAVVAAIALLLAVIGLCHARYYSHRGVRTDKHLREQEEELQEQIGMMRLKVEKGERQHLEQRAKVSLAMGVLPLIDRIIYAVGHAQQSVQKGKDPDSQMAYIRELTEEIERQNGLLTNWIQLRKGEVSLRVETFPLKDVFDMVSRSAGTFAMKGITLTIEATDASVKADRVLTLFMINTLADNARKFTPEGGTVTICATETNEYVEVSVKDTGCGMDEEQLASLFSPFTPHPSPDRQGHGFGLLNCKGIIEKYRKMSSRFSVCLLSAESTVGEGSRFFFRLPKGTAMSASQAPAKHLLPMTVMALVTALSPLASHSSPQVSSHSLARAAAYADSAYFSNIKGTYERTLLFADSCRSCLNDHYRTQRPQSADTLLSMDDLSTTLPELTWLHDSLDTNYSIILDIRNESAVAALALHRWNLYQYNNRIYTQLFKELSADATLDDYCRKMQQSQTNRRVAIVMLVVLFIGILAAVAWQLMQTMNASARRRQQQQDRLDMLGDELQRLTIEANALHVSNAVLDNTLSTLKHETMYYPSRIWQLVGSRQTGDYGQIREVVAYYRELYGLFSGQSMEQTKAVRLHLRVLDHEILGDENLFSYLFDLLRKGSGQDELHTSYTVSGDGRYVECRVSMPSLSDTGLFTPSDETGIPFLLCRQIVRDHGEATGRRACAIRAEKADEGVTVVICLPRAAKLPK